jgi:hypothetical protein
MDTTNGSLAPYNPLIWWQGQHVMGNELEGLTQMALDVLGTPGTFTLLFQRVIYG